MRWRDRRREGYWTATPGCLGMTWRGAIGRCMCAGDRAGRVDRVAMRLRKYGGGSCWCRRRELNPDSMASGMCCAMPAWGIRTSALLST